MNRPASPLPVASAAFWRAYWLTMRPYLLVVSGAAGLVGLALAPEVPALRFSVAVAVFYASYGLGQALTDVFQTDTDALSSPYRPLVQGLLGPTQVAAVTSVGLALCALALAWLNPATLALSLLLVAGLVAYTPLKRRWWGGPPWNAWIVALLPALGALAAGSSMSSLARLPLLLRASGSVFFSYAAFVLLGYLKDVEADRRSGYRTMPVRFGRRPSVAVSALLATLAVACSAPFVAPALGADVEAARLPGAVLWGLGVALLAAAHAAAWPVKSDDEAHPAIALALRGFVALHLGEAVLVRPGLALLAVASLALGEWALRSRPSRTQT